MPFGFGGGRARADRAAAAARFGIIELHGGHGARVAIVPALGGKIAALELGGRQWLWTSDVIAWAAPVDGASYVETADTGGYDECFPTVGACTLPDDVPGYGGLALPDHGELWSARPSLLVATGDDGRGPWQRATCTWEGRRMPYRFTRVVELDSSGTVTMRYAATNLGAVALPFLWSSHPLLPLTDETRLLLPAGSRTRVWAEHRVELGGPGAEFRWPQVATGKKTLDFSRPDAVARRYACKLFLDLAPEPVTLAIEEGDARLEVTVDGREVPHMGLWLNRGGWTPFDDGTAYHNLAFEPCIGAGDDLSAGLGDRWQSAASLAPDETRTWTLAWRGVRSAAAAATD